MADSTELPTYPKEYASAHQSGARSEKPGVLVNLIARFHCLPDQSIPSIVIENQLRLHTESSCCVWTIGATAEMINVMSAIISRLPPKCTGENPGKSHRNAGCPFHMEDCYSY